ncbi:hypothetical protein ACFYWY_34870 [Streptomyces sp. NPDC002870]|uniref:hypothetical protein n=1 Tax=Streptomyces sp. NPDC002870 TaxID=3364666 RepID=UPI0036B705C5
MTDEIGEGSGQVTGTGVGVRTRERGPGSTRDIAMNTVRHACAVAQDEVHAPAANLRLLAKSVDHLSR